jgi:hypothetical protein
MRKRIIAGNDSGHVSKVRRHHATKERWICTCWCGRSVTNKHVHTAPSGKPYCSAKCARKHQRVQDQDQALTVVE